MDSQTYTLLEKYMLSCMTDSAHDKDHVYRVLYTALNIAKYEDNVDHDVLVCACLLHDIGRNDQLADPTVCHAEAGSKKAYAFLTANGFDEVFCQKVKKCILTHRFRKTAQPESIEAKILFDADKLDVAGALGIARTLIYKGEVTEPLYSLTEDGGVSSGENDTAPSFFSEYHYKLKNIYGSFYTKTGASLAKERRQAAVDFYNAILSEVRFSYEKGASYLEEIIK